ISIERIAYRPLRHAPRLAPLITAVGVSFFLEGVLFLWKGPSNVHYANIIPNAGFEIFGATIGAKDLLVIGVSIVLVIGLALFVDRTRLGKAMRATAQDRVRRPARRRDLLPHSRERHHRRELVRDHDH